QVLDNLKDQYLKLESQIQEVDNYYKEIIAEIAKKQGVSKKYIRHALNDLQEALSLLDMSHADYIEPTHIKEEFGKMVEDSTAMFQEFREMKGLPQGSTIIKNIETVNVSLADTPAIEGVFNEIAQITKATRSGLEKSAQASLKESQATSSAGGAGASAGTAKGAKGAGAADAGAGAGTAGEASGAGTQAGKGEAKAAGSGAEDEKKKASLGELSSDRGREETPQKKKLPEDQIQEVIFRKGRNYAPFNWREILSDIQLKRFESFIESCIKAEKEGKFMKALGLYRTIKEQPGIADTIAGRLLEDHIEYLEDLIKRKYSFKYKPTVPDKKVQIT
ncbi:MAG: hypothetical protein KKH98_10730, partial [Spirochaetes bacterium]|nr:hypothetical protein [Spirochaetota bacterium]